MLKKPRSKQVRGQAGDRNESASFKVIEPQRVNCLIASYMSLPKQLDLVTSVWFLDKNINFSHTNLS